MQVNLLQLVLEEIVRKGLNIAAMNEKFLQASPRTRHHLQLLILNTLNNRKMQLNDLEPLFDKLTSWNVRNFSCLNILDQ